MNAVWHILRLTLQEARRKKLLALLLLLSALFVVFYLYGVYRLQLNLSERAASAGLSPHRRGLGAMPVVFSALFGMYLVYFLASLLSVLSTVAAISGDLETGVMQSIIARPVSRAQLVLGRWLGFTLVNGLYVVLLSAALLGGVYAITGYLPPAPVQAVGYILLSTILMSSLTVLGSTLFATLANGIAVFVLYGLGSAGGILSALGSLSSSAIMLTLGRAANILMPTNALWLGASYHLQPEAALALGRMGRGSNPFFATEPMNTGLLLWAALYSVLALLLAMWHFSRRDL